MSADFSVYRYALVAAAGRLEGAAQEVRGPAETTGVPASRALGPVYVSSAVDDYEAAWRQAGRETAESVAPGPRATAANYRSAEDAIAVSFDQVRSALPRWQ